jgi:hypothetical protein
VQIRTAAIVALALAPLNPPAPQALVRPIATIAIPALREASGLVASHHYAGVLWAHNDSGDQPRLFAFRRDGVAVLPNRVTDPARYRGITIDNARNYDWEDITIDPDRRLYIGDIGNNDSARRNLAIYVVDEPDPVAGTAVRATRAPFVYPDQKQFPPPLPQRSFDAEALFWADGKLHLLTKRLGDRRTALYRFDSLTAGAPNVPTLVEAFDAGILVTGASATPDGRRLAVLGYTPSLLGLVDVVYVFERPNAAGPWFSGSVRQRRFSGAQLAEGICWVGNALLVTNEGGQIFELSIDDFTAVGPHR